MELVAQSLSDVYISYVSDVHSSDNNLQKDIYGPQKRRRGNKLDTDTKIRKANSFDMTLQNNWLTVMNRLDDTNLDILHYTFECNLTHYVNYSTYWTTSQKRDVFYLMVSILLKINPTVNHKDLSDHCKQYRQILVESFPYLPLFTIAAPVNKLLQGIYQNKRDNDLFLFYNDYNHDENNHDVFPTFKTIQALFYELLNCGFNTEVSYQLINQIIFYYHEYTYIRDTFMLCICQVLKSRSNNILNIIQVIYQILPYNIALFKSLLFLLSTDLEDISIEMISQCIKKWVMEPDSVDYIDRIVYMLVRNYKYRSFVNKSNILPIFKILFNNVDITYQEIILECITSNIQYYYDPLIIRNLIWFYYTFSFRFNPQKHGGFLFFIRSSQVNSILNRQ